MQLTIWPSDLDFLSENLFFLEQASIVTQGKGLYINEGIKSNRICNKEIMAWPKIVSIKYFMEQWLALISPLFSLTITSSMASSRPKYYFREVFFKTDRLDLMALIHYVRWNNFWYRFLHIQSTALYNWYIHELLAHCQEFIAIEPTTREILFFLYWFTISETAFKWFFFVSRRTLLFEINLRVAKLF